MAGSIPSECESPSPTITSNHTIAMRIISTSPYSPPGFSNDSPVRFKEHSQAKLKNKLLEYDNRFKIGSFSDGGEHGLSPIAGSLNSSQKSSSHFSNMKLFQN